MASITIQTDIRFSKDCQTIYISDVTRSYNAFTNPNGYDTTGAVNLDPNDIDTDTGYITFEASDGTSVTYNLSSTDFVIANIDTTGLISVAITMDDLEELGLDTSDDVWKITYGYTDDSDEEYTSICYIVKDCTACCVINALLANIDLCTNCKAQSVTNKINEILMAQVALKMASAKAACGDITGAKELLDYVNSLSTVTRCDACN